MARHWSEVLSCSGCGMRFRSLSEEARHRHNFPVLCRAPQTTYRFRETTTGRRVSVYSRSGERDARRRAANALSRRCRVHLGVAWDLVLLEVKK